VQHVLAPNHCIDRTHDRSGHDHNVSSISFTPSGEHLISASRDTTIRIWEVGTGFNVRTIKGHTEWVRAARPDPSGTLIGSCGNDQTVRVWSFETGAEKHVMNKHTHVVSLQCAPSACSAPLRLAPDCHTNADLTVALL
jgi:platelet-activating factor acetylhydrolase IB subunit alpha